MIIDLRDVSVKARQDYLQAAIAPRPIGWVSTVDRDGHPNLAPFSFFNLFSAHPPIVIFSPARRVKDNTTKHTLENLYQVPEAVIHIVTADLLTRANQTSYDYPKGVNEFAESGLTEVPATLVRPPMIKESPVKMECRVMEIKPMGKEGGAGNLIICEVLCLHLSGDILDEDGQIDPRRLSHVARLGGDWYCSVGETNLFTLPKPVNPVNK
jgi:flavin reductase (DIM6/NTAB) family NADH-FMN oxidoreductase RutF